MDYPLKGKAWVYVGTALMLVSLILFLHYVTQAVELKELQVLGMYFIIFLTLFLSFSMLRIYAITPLMSPKFAVRVVIVLVVASQLFTIFYSLGYFFIGLVAGGFAELIAFNWARSTSRELYEKSL